MRSGEQPRVEGGSSSGGCALLFLPFLWFCLDDWLAAITNVPELGAVPWFVPLVAFVLLLLIGTCLGLVK